MMKNINKIITFMFVMILVICLTGCNSNNVVLKVDIKDEGTFYSQVFQVDNENVNVSSNMDCAIDIVNIDNEDDCISIGYLTPGMSEEVSLKKDYKYRIKVDSDVEDLGDLEITVTW